MFKYTSILVYKLNNVENVLLFGLKPALLNASSLTILCGTQKKQKVCPSIWTKGFIRPWATSYASIVMKTVDQQWSLT